MLKKINYLLLIITLLVGISSCAKEETDPNGTLVVLVRLAGQSGNYAGAEVGIATSIENLQNQVFLDIKETTASGARFTLLPGTYYFAAAADVAGSIFYGEGQVQVTAGKTTELPLIIQ